METGWTEHIITAEFLQVEKWEMRQKCQNIFGVKRF
jgi:hypothetical protein